ncbi:MAG: NAD/NADP octopine/nopaline dehydrogenase family protein [Bauldia sp.]|nr:NAD/NADP octopine/nopaline dehydrogenase family protein [Bauldia sp.]
MRIAIIGGPALAAEAADLALAGHDVVLAAWPAEEAALQAIRDAGAVNLVGEVEHALSGKTGTAAVPVSTIAEAVRGAALVLVAFEPADVEDAFATLAPHLEPGQVVHIDTYGYWAALRGWKVLAAHGKTEVTLTESIAPLATGLSTGTDARLVWRRRQLPVAAMPASRTETAFAVLREVFASVRPAENVLATGFANLNMLVHPAIALVNVGWFDRATEEDGKANFYGAGNTASASRLTEALDVERQAACAAFGVPWESVLRYVRDLYGATGDDFRTLVRNTGLYAMPDHDPQLGIGWLRADIPYAVAPFVAVAGLAGARLPLHKGLEAIFCAILGAEIAGRAIGLQELGLAGADFRAVRRYVTDGAF